MLCKGFPISNGMDNEKVLDKQGVEKPVMNVPETVLPIEPLTLHEVDEQITKRVTRIDHEFKEGFEFLKYQPKSVSIFGSTRFTENNHHYEQARSLAGKFAKLGYTVVTGGGPGVMEAANRGAFENGGKSLGITIELPHAQVKNPYLTDYEDFYYFFTRKVMLSFSAEAYIFFPGGYGTLDEFFEIITLVQTNKIEPVPVICMGTDYWNELHNFIKTNIFEKHDSIEKADMDLYTITDDEDLVIDIVKKVPIRDGVRCKY